MRRHDDQFDHRTEHTEQSSDLLRANKFVVGLILALGLLSASIAVQADESSQRRYTASIQVAAALDAVPLNKDYALGINRFDVDDHTEILGWQIADDWYFGRQDGLDSGLTLLWQQSSNQFSLSKDGMRLTRRF